jgi:hypothetical protein
MCIFMRHDLRLLISRCLVRFLLPWCCCPISLAEMIFKYNCFYFLVIATAGANSPQTVTVALISGYAHLSSPQCSFSEVLIDVVHVLESPYCYPSHPAGYVLPSHRNPSLRGHSFYSLPTTRRPFCRRCTF